nr:hypothetical protein CFP56_53913 [Quercus suber]
MNMVVVISNEMMAQIRATSTETPGCFDSHGESSCVEADSDSRPSQEMRPVNMLQRGYTRDSQVYDDMEIGVELVQGSSKEARVDYGGCCNNES